MNKLKTSTTSMPARPFIIHSQDVVTSLAGEAPDFRKGEESGLRLVNTGEKAGGAGCVRVIFASEKAAKMIVFKLHSTNVNPDPSDGERPRDRAGHGQGKRYAANDESRIARMAYEAIRSAAHHLPIAQITKLPREIGVGPNEPSGTSHAENQAG